MALTVTEFCVRTVSHAPRNHGQTPSFTGTRRRILMLLEVVDRECVGAFRCASARASGINFQACSFNHSDISPSLESYTWLAFEIVQIPDCDTSPNVLGSLTGAHSPELRGTELSKQPGLCRLPIPHHRLWRHV